MARKQLNAQFFLLAALGDDDSKPYAAQMDVNGAIIVSGGGGGDVDAADVTYSPDDSDDWLSVPSHVAPALDELAARVTDDDLLLTDYLLPTRASWFHYDSLVTVGNAITHTAATTQYFQYRGQQVAAANGDTFTHTCMLKAGAYTMRLLGTTDTSHGKLDVFHRHCSEVAFTTDTTGLDWYATPAAVNVEKTFSVTIAISGRQVFKFVVNGKHASSSAYNIILTKFDLRLAAGDS